MRRWLPVLVFLGVLCLYLRTLVPGIYVSDFVEFQYQPRLLGLPHPNGFPLYMLFGWLWSHLPAGDTAWRMNALSAVGGALAAAITTAFAQRVSRRASVGLLAGGLVALSPTMWYYSLAAERYTLNIALLAAALWSAWEARQRLAVSKSGTATTIQPDRRSAARLAYLSGLLLGVGLTVHPSDVLFGPFWLAYLFWGLPGLRRELGFWVKLALATAAPLLLFVYVPWRWQAFADLPLVPGIGRSSAVYQGLVHVWYEPALTLTLLRQYILGLSGYATNFFLGGWQDALKGLWVLQPYWGNNVAPVLLVLAGLGLLRLLRLDAALALALAGSAVFVALMTAYITQGKNDAYLTPTFWVIFFCAAFALDLLIAVVGRVGKRRPSQPPQTAGEAAPASAVSGSDAKASRELDAPAARLADTIALLAVAGVLLVLLWQRYPDSDLSRWTDTRDDWHVTLAHPLDDGAALLGHWSDLTPLWYLQQIEGKRQDLLGLFPPDPDAVVQPWLEQGKALYLAAPLNEYAPGLVGRYTMMPWGKLVRILLPSQTATCPDQSNTTETPAAWPFAITSWDIESRLSSDTPGTLRFCWEARAELPPDTFVRLHLRALQDGHELNVNRPLLPEWLPRTSIPPDDTGLAVVDVRLPLGTAPGDYAVELVPYRLLADDSIEAWPGVEALSLGQVAVEPATQFRRATLTDETAPLVPLRSGPLALRAWRVSDQPVRPGDPVQAEFLWEIRERLPAETLLQLSIGFRSAPLGRLAGPPHLTPLTLPADAQPGTLVRTVHAIPAPRGVGDETYWVEPRLQGGDRTLPWLPTGRLVVGAVRVKDRPHLETLPSSAQPVTASFADLADLAGYEIQPPSPRPGDSLTVTLYWQPQAETNRSYAVFVHLVDAEGQIVAQHDSIPAEGTLATTLWIPGEVIADPHTLSLPPDLPPGDYVVRVGLYDPSTLERIAISSESPVHDAALDIDHLAVEP